MYQGAGCQSSGSSRRRIVCRLLFVGQRPWDSFRGSCVTMLNETKGSFLIGKMETTTLPPAPRLCISVFFLLFSFLLFFSFSFQDRHYHSANSYLFLIDIHLVKFTIRYSLSSWVWTTCLIPQIESLFEERLEPGSVMFTVLSLLHFGATWRGFS